MQAIVAREAGGPEVLELEEVTDPVPGPGEVLVRVHAAGVNFVDTYQRRGQYPVPFPARLGLEGAGTVAAVGEGVGEIREADRVAWAQTMGSYAELATVPVEDLVVVPEGIDLDTAAAVMLQGMTAHFLACSTFPLDSSHVALVHAGAGGVGHLLVQIAKRRGAWVITTVSTEEKAELARQAGADDVIRYTEVDFAAAVADLTGGVHVVYDSVGATTFDRSLQCLLPRGMLVLYGQSSGPVGPIDPQALNRNGSLFLTRPGLAHHTATPQERRWRASELFSWITAGELEVRRDRAWPLAEAADAHRYLEGRQSKGKLLLHPPNP